MKQSYHLILLILISATFGSLKLTANEDQYPCATVLKQANYPVALTVCQANLAAALAANDETSTIQLYLLLADIQHALGDSAKEQELLDKIADHPLFQQNAEFNYAWHRKMGQKFYFTNDFVSAKQHLYQALELALQNNNALWKSKSYNDVGLVELKLNNFKESLIYYQKSLEIKKQFGDLYQIGTTLNNLGLIHLKMEDKPNAVNYYERALSAFLEYTQQHDFDQRVLTNIAHLYEDLAVIYTQTNNLDKQHYYLQKTINTIELKSSARQQARALVNVAKIQIDNANYASAKIFLQKSALLQDKHQLNLKAEINLQLAKLYELTGETEKAISFANVGLVSAQDNNDIQLSAELYELLSRLFRESDSITSFHYFELFHQSREKYLAQKYDGELKTVQFRIEKQQIESDLIAEQLKNEKSKSKIQILTNWVLLAVLMLLLSIGFTVFHLFKKKREKLDLLQNIAYHKQQLLVLDDKYRNLSKTVSDEHSSDENKQDLRHILVRTMLDAVTIWEKHSGKNRVELAEQSKIWTVSIDEGTLRTRSLDKYLSIEKIPLNPRWRNVVRTCHFVLSHDDLKEQDRSMMNVHLASLLKAVKELSLESVAA